MRSVSADRRMSALRSHRIAATLWSFNASIPPGYLIQGSRQELLQRVEALRDSLRKMSPDQLQVNEITEDDRRVQMSLYEKLAAALRTAK